MKHDNTAEVDYLGGYDELELVELNDTDASGGTTWACVTIATLVSFQLCPSTACSRAC